MNEAEERRMEAALRGIVPAQPPADLMARLAAAKPAPQIRRASGARRASARPAWFPLWRWLIPATAVVMAGLACWRLNLIPAWHSQPVVAAVTGPKLKADEVQIDRQLISAFDAVGKLPDGEPVRYHCQEWMDKVELRDTSRGLVVQQSTPRLEVMPVNFETY
jgi:hypothetical protein